MKKYGLTLLCSLITPFLLAIVVFLMGGGHGNYMPAIFLFPWGMIGMLLFQHFTLPTIIMGVIQYPIYGLILDKKKNNGKIDQAIVTILLIHLILAMGMLILYSNK